MYLTTGIDSSAFIFDSWCTIFLIQINENKEF
jgi:hypothetical protein